MTFPEGCLQQLQASFLTVASQICHRLATVEKDYGGKSPAERVIADARRRGSDLNFGQYFGDNPLPVICNLVMDAA